ncbi:MAG: ester cyclase [Gammaproteobacteria bacterium]|nr:ester cyclase [Gammaproteobacteria bacterium]
MSAMKETYNKKLGLLINRDIWNDKKFEKIPDYFTEDFVADYSPRVIRNGRNQIEQMVLSAHATFEGFRETVHHVVADETQVVLHFTITGRQIKDWGPVTATNKLVKYDEIVIMQIRDGRVCRQIGVADTLLALQQLGRIPDPGGFVENSFEKRD